MIKLFQCPFVMISTHSAMAAGHIPAFPKTDGDLFTKEKHIYLTDNMVIFPLEERNHRMRYQICDRATCSCSFYV